MPSARAIFQAHVDDVFGVTTESLPILLQWSIPSSNCDIDQIDLVNGANTLTPPAGTRLAAFVPPAGNGVTLTLKGIAGDTGIVISPGTPLVLTFSIPNPFVITAGGAVPGCRIIWL